MVTVRQHKMVDGLESDDVNPYDSMLSCSLTAWHKVTEWCLNEDTGAESTTPANKYRDAPKRPASKVRRTLVTKKKKVKK